MSRFKLQLPASFPFSTHIPVRITDVNYGGHVGNDAILGLIHEARMQFLHHYQLSELGFAGAGLIMSDVVIEFKSELFYGEVLTAYVAASDASRVSFSIFYKLVKTVGDKEVVFATAKTGMVCYDYSTKKVVAIPEAAQRSLFA